MRRIPNMLLLLLALVGLSAPLAAQPRPLLVFAASSLQDVLGTIGADFQREHNVTIRFSHAASAALVRQLDQGAPADVLITADLDWMDHAQAAGLLNNASRRSVIGNALVLVGAREDAPPVKLVPGLDLAGVLGASRLAMGNPASVPAGTYAKAALTSLNLWDSVAERIAGAENVRAALALVARGEARLGIAYASDAKADARVRVLDTFPAGSHAPILYPAALTKGATHPAAQAFLDYLSGPAARQRFLAAGFAALP